MKFLEIHIRTWIKAATTTSDGHFAKWDVGQDSQKQQLRPSHAARGPSGSVRLVRSVWSGPSALPGWSGPTGLFSWPDFC